MEVVFGFLLMLLFSFDLILKEKSSIAIRRIILGAITVCYLGLVVGLAILAIKVNNVIVKTFLILVIALILRVLTKLWLKL
ncbi:hypothetical protein SDC9_187056 [bioreactor metagenome]|uniref:Uncharacterized protein n=1 Tax=bioreactor metagenome TaxID=1076179 RepID=A0A645HKI3_9ZZZZ